MSINQLPLPIAAYVHAINAEDATAALRCFTPDAHVHDEGADYQGTAAIKGWLVETQRKSHFTMEVLNAKTVANDTELTMRLAGTFPGSPIELHSHFKLDATHIRDLRIHA